MTASPPRGMLLLLLRAANSSGATLELLPQQRGPWYRQRQQSRWQQCRATPRNLKVSRTITLQIPISRLKNVNQAFLLYCKIMKVAVKIRPLSKETSKDTNGDLLA